MSSPLFVVPLADLERGPKEVVWTVPEGWLRGAFADTEAVPAGAGELDAQLTKTGREVVVQGKARATVTLPDAFTMDPVTVELVAEITLLLAPAPEPDPRARRAGRKAGKGRGDHGHGHKEHRPAKKGAWAEDPELSEEEASRDTYAGEQVVLDPFVREFLLLELPMTVRRSDLRSTDDPASAPPSAEPEAKPHPIDPRLAPLAAIASRLRGKKE